MSRAIIKEIRTKYSFSNEEVIEALKIFGNLPKESTPELSYDGDSFYGDLELTTYEIVGSLGIDIK